MSPRHVVPSKSRGTNASRFLPAIALATSLVATLSSPLLTSSKHAALTLLFATLSWVARVSPLLATLTKNTGGGGRARSLRLLQFRYLLTRLVSPTYTHPSHLSRHCVPDTH